MRAEEIPSDRLEFCVVEGAEGELLAFCVAVVCGGFAGRGGLQREGVGTAHFIDKIINYY